MNLETINEYEANGIQVTILDSPDPHFRTRTFVRLPGRSIDLPHYDVFYQIPHLNNNEEFVLASTAVHPEDRRDNETLLWTDLDGTMGATNLAAITLIALATLTIQIVGAIIIFICLYYILNLLFDPAPCGITGSEIPINECYKKIIFPDCSWKWFNSCAGHDNNGDGHPDGQTEDEGGGKDIYDQIMQIIIVGAVVVGGIFVLKSFLKPGGVSSFLKPRSRKKTSKNGSKWQGSPAWVNY